MPDKRGPVTKDELAFIKENAGKLTPADIAEKLGRTEATVRTVMIEKLRVSPDHETPEERVAQLAIQKELMNSPEWTALKAEFTDDELKYFKHRYAKLMAQFGDDVTATEETQIFTLIRLEIITHRIMSDMKQSEEDIMRTRKMLDDLYDQYPSASDMPDSDKRMAENLENQLVSARVAKGAKTGEYKHMLAQQASTMKDLKATRDQRFTKIENSKETMIELLKDMQRADMRAREGKYQNLVDKATEKERLRLSQQHTFGDGSVEQPLLTPENVA